MDANYILQDFMRQRSNVKADDIEWIKEIDKGVVLIQTKAHGVFEYDYYSKAALCRDTIEGIREFHAGYDEESWCAEFGRRLLHKLDETGISVERLSDISGISLAQLYNYINGRSIPSAYRAAVLEKQLGCSPGYLNPFNCKI